MPLIISLTEKNKSVRNKFCMCMETVAHSTGLKGLDKKKKKMKTSNSNLKPHSLNISLPHLRGKQSV